MRRGGLRVRSTVVALAALLAVGPSVARAERASANPPSGFATQVILSHVDNGAGGVPTSFAYAPDGRIFIGRKTGVVNVWDRGVQHTFVDMRDQVNSVQSRGLVGLALDPNFATTGKVFILYTEELDPSNPDQGGPAGGQVVSMKAKPTDKDSADLSTESVIVTGFNSVSRLHSVGGLRFDNQGNLLVGFADASDNGVNEGQALAAQDLTQLNGKLLRVDPITGDGIPSNPFYNGNPTSVQSRIYAFGLRNPFRFTVDPNNGNVYMGEVGWNTWEQLDVFTPTFGNPLHDRNAGWPCYEGGNGVPLVQPDYQSAPVSASTCHKIYKPSEGGTGVGSLAPLYGYRHDDPGGAAGSAIVGGPKYTGSGPAADYPSQYVGQIFIGDFRRDRIQTVDPVTGNATDFGTPGSWGDPVDMQIAPSGNVAVLGLGTAQLSEIVYTGSTNRPPVAVASANPTSGAAAPLIVHFSSAGTTDPDGDPLTYKWNFGDGNRSSLANPRHKYTTTGAFTATLTVSDGHPGGTDISAPLQISVADAMPTISFLAPDPSLRYAIGDTINVQLTANDTEDGPLSGDSVETKINEHAGGGVFPAGDFSGLTGSFVAADLGFPDQYYELVSTATDSTGQSTTVTMNVLPATVNLTVASAPPGVSMTVDGVSHATPYTFPAVVGSGHELLAPTVTTIGGPVAAFDTWSTPAGVVPDPFTSITTPATDTTVAARYNSTADGFAISDASVVEGDSGARTVALTVSRSVASASVSSVDWTTVPGTASATSDYTTVSGTVTFAAGETSHTITVPVKGDTTVEPDEQFTVNLSNPQGAAIVVPTGTVTVLNDDPASGGLRADVGDVEVMEGGSGTRSAAFTVTLSASSPGAVSVDYTTVDGSAVAPGDYTPASGTLTFAAGQYSQTVEVAVSGDRDGEPTEQFTLALSNPVGVTLGRAAGVARIATDDPIPAVSISSGNFYEGDSGKPKVPFTVSLSVPSAKPVTVDWTASHASTDDADVKLASGTVTIPAGALQAVVDVTTRADTVAEPDEVFVVTLSNAVGATIGADTGTGIEVILNDDPGSPANRLAIGNVAVPEGHAGERDAQFLVTLATPSVSPTTVHYATADGSATAGSDYVARSGTLTIPAGAVSRILPIPIIGDSLHEGDESLTVTLTNASGATITQAVGTATIVDDD